MKVKKIPRQGKPLHTLVFAQAADDCIEEEPEGDNPVADEVPNEGDSWISMVCFSTRWEGLDLGEGRRYSTPRGLPIYI